MQKGGWLVMELSTPEEDKSVIELFRLEGAEDDTYRVYPKGLNNAGSYEVYSDNKGAAGSYTISGYMLAAEGIPVRLAGKLTSEILVIKQIYKEQIDGKR
jgi:hypothetical protein